MVLCQLSCLLYAFGIDSNHATREPCSSFLLVYDESFRQCVLANVINVLPGENWLFQQLPRLVLYQGVLCLITHLLLYTPSALVHLDSFNS